MAALLFGYVGRLRIKSTTQSKNLVALLKAAKTVTDELPATKLVLAGAGYEEEMKPLVEKMGLEKSLIYVGNIPYVKNPEFLRMCDLIVRQEKLETGYRSMSGGCSQKSSSVYIDMT
jgi:glycosyltransferase involved in cell wall biosynthesis